MFENETLEITVNLTKLKVEFNFDQISHRTRQERTKRQRQRRETASLERKVERNLTYRSFNYRSIIQFAFGWVVARVE